MTTMISFFLLRTIRYSYLFVTMSAFYHYTATFIIHELQALRIC